MQYSYILLFCHGKFKTMNGKIYAKIHALLLQLLHTRPPLNLKNNEKILWKALVNAMKKVH